MIKLQNQITSISLVKYQQLADIFYTSPFYAILNYFGFPILHAHLHLEAYPSQTKYLLGQRLHEYLCPASDPGGHSGTFALRPECSSLPPNRAGLCRYRSVGPVFSGRASLRPAERGTGLHSAREGGRPPQWLRGAHVRGPHRQGKVEQVGGR